MTNNLSQALVLAEGQLFDLSNSSSLLQIFATSFGTIYNQQKVFQLQSDWQSNNFSNLPQIELISGDILGGAVGAYATTNNTIYLADNWVNSASSDAISAVLLEEIGHSIDAQINPEDAAGDEGYIFSALTRGQNLTAQELSDLKQENDWSNINVQGQSLPVENSVITLTVNTTDDQNDGSLTNGLSLRDAIQIANQNVQNQYIILLTGGANYTLRLPGVEDNNQGGDLDIWNNSNITIRATGGQQATIDAGGLLERDRVIHITGSNATLQLENVVITRGRGDYGGGIYTHGTLVLINTTVTNNNTNGYAGGIYNDGTLTLINTTISGNSAHDSGGGIRHYSGTLTLINTTISGNSAYGDGGGIYNDSTAYAINTTITNNTADFDNSGYGDGGGIYSYRTFDLRNTIIAGNFDNTSGSRTNNPDVSGTFVGNKNNIIGNTFGGTGFGATDQLNVDPRLGPLQYNGGLTATHALLYGSPAINRGDKTLVPADTYDINKNSNTTETIPVDQRGYTRIVGSNVDIGAVERQSSAVAVINTPVHRFSNKNIPGTHFYTASEAERQNVVNNYPQYKYDGIAFRVGISPADDLIPVHRFSNQNVPGTHFYTASEVERQSVIANYPQFNYDGIAYYVYDGSANLGADVYRFSNTSVPGTHFYTASAAEYQNVIANYPQFQLDGVAYEVSIL